MYIAVNFQQKMSYCLILLTIVTLSIMPAMATADDPSAFVDVIDMIGLTINDAFNGSYLYRRLYRGIDINPSFMPGRV
jgi:hypothetical protein